MKTYLLSISILFWAIINNDLFAQRGGRTSTTFSSKGKSAARMGSQAAISSTPKPVFSSASSTAQNIAKNIGRSGKQARLRQLGENDRISSANRGWIKQEQNAIAKGQRKTIRVPPGTELAHDRGKEAAKGYSYAHSNLQSKELHTIQHKIDNFGKKIK